MSLESNRIVFAIIVCVALSGCAATSPSNPKDPFEGFNRTMLKFNDKVDDVALKPAATVYQAVLPTMVQTGISNFFGNLADVWTAANNLMQGDIEGGLSDAMRVAVNSTLGLAGLLDIGSEAGMVKHREDFGQTLGVWGIKPGPYVILPIFGPQTMRDTIAFPVDFKADPWAYKYPVRWRNVGTAIRMVDRRAVLLDASNLLEDASLDRYQFMRDAYLQRRESQVNNGEAPPDDEAYDDDDMEQEVLRDGGTEPISAVDQQLTPSVSSDLSPEQLIVNDRAGIATRPSSSNSLLNQEKHEKAE